jgi:hypothetical protein
VISSIFHVKLFNNILKGHNYTPIEVNLFQLVELDKLRLGTRREVRMYIFQSKIFTFFNFLVLFLTFVREGILGAGVQGWKGPGHCGEEPQREQGWRRTEVYQGAHRKYKSRQSKK